MTTTRGEGSGGHEVVARGREQVQTIALQTVTILHHTTDGCLTTFLCTAQGLVLKGGDSAGLVARTGVLAHRLTVREEILFEVIDHRDRLIEQLFRPTTVHQDRFSTKHLRHLGQHAGAALSHEPVAELSHKRIGCDTRETVRATTLQTHTEFAYGHTLTLVLLSNVVEFAQDGHTGFHLVFHLLGDE